MGILSDSDFLKWPKGEVPFLEKVVKSSLSKLTPSSKIVRKFAREKALKRSYTFYKMWKKKIHLDDKVQSFDAEGIISEFK